MSSLVAGGGQNEELGADKNCLEDNFSVCRLRTENSKYIYPV